VLASPFFVPEMMEGDISSRSKSRPPTAKYTPKILYVCHPTLKMIPPTIDHRHRDESNKRGFNDFIRRQCGKQRVHGFIHVCLDI